MDLFNQASIYKNIINRCCQFMERLPSRDLLEFGGIFEDELEIQWLGFYGSIPVWNISKISDFGILRNFYLFPPGNTATCFIHFQQKKKHCSSTAMFFFFFLQYENRKRKIHAHPKIPPFTHNPPF